MSCRHQASKHVRFTKKGAVDKCLFCGKEYYSYAGLNKPDSAWRKGKEVIE